MLVAVLYDGERDLSRCLAFQRKFTYCCIGRNGFYKHTLHKEFNTNFLLKCGIAIFETIGSHYSGIGLIVPLISLIA